MTGDLSSLSNLTELTELLIQETGVIGDLSSFAKMSKLATLHCSDNISGSIDLLQSNALQNLWAGTLSGDLARISNKLLFLSCNKYSSFTWSSRESSSTIFGIEGSPTVTNIDKMLQDLTNCQIPSDATSGWMKSISIKGTRTSASDAAVQTLQSKGYTVSITPA